VYAGALATLLALVACNPDPALVGGVDLMALGM
jgi:hypothetical protein